MSGPEPTRAFPAPAVRAYTQPLDQQDGGPLLHPPSPLSRERKPGQLLAEGLRMSPQNKRERKRGGGRGAGAGFSHQPVMLAEVLEAFSPLAPGFVLDATVGGGGHARALLGAFPHLSVVGLDQDEDALVAAAEALAPFAGRYRLERARFDRLGAVLDNLGPAAQPLVGALFDLGVSSPQLDRPERGFSYRYDAPLDMRMDRSAPLTAAELVNSNTPAQLARLFAQHGEERFAGRIASAIVAARPLSSTVQLADVVAGAVPAAVRRRGHPAKRVFQALRVAVNSELEVLPVAIDAALERVAAGGRVVVLSYHSGEDRLVKERFLNAATGGCTCPPGLPCACGAVGTVRLLNRGARKPSPAEVASNPRAESARFPRCRGIGGKGPMSPAGPRLGATAAEEVAVPLVQGRGAAAAPGQVPEPTAPGRQQPSQPHLQLVPRQGRLWANRRQLLIGLVIAAGAAMCLALVALHVLMAENQFGMDRLQQQVTAQQSVYEKLRLEVAELEAPARIIGLAEGRLGMAQPASVTYLPAISASGTPRASRSGHGRPGAQPARAGTKSAGPFGSGPSASGPADSSARNSSPSTVPAPTGDADWPLIKPFLSGNP